ncbi:hypothetical protein LTS18_005522 [Coniosporium uncinatum]|uniref:Uncharacterized protein n=1 Tax=Coniosporium uncinatum TaxID=93489 RepID=A0ACC3DR29_9PEZI|nr:hypothetical protein LTS18_005522 [Coniosporium uncinatum]
MRADSRLEAHRSTTSLLSILKLEDPEHSTSVHAKSSESTERLASVQDPEADSTPEKAEGGTKSRRKSFTKYFRHRRSSSADLLSKLKGNGSRLSLGTKRTPSGEELPTIGSEHPEQLDHIGEDAPLQNGLVNGEEVQQEEVEEDPENWGPPTTLLAELQVRKAHQKTRNRTAATAFPNGMHSTLLQLDAVAQIEKKNRQGQRVALAWEDAGAVDAANNDDEDVPLGMLFANRKGLVNEMDNRSRPLGLMEKRELEDNEPLSRRRNRLRGGDTGPVRGPSPSKNQSTHNLAMPNASQIHLGGASPQPAGTPSAETPEDAEQRPASEAFALDLLNNLGIKTADDKSSAAEPPKPQPTPDSENETLGQRRARLQAEARSRQASGNTIASAVPPPLAGADAPSQARPALKTTKSMADLLASHPVGGLADGARKVSNDQLLNSMPVTGGLLAKSQLRQDAKRRNLLESNRRSSTYGLGRPLVEVRGPADTYAALKGGPFMGGMYNTGAGIGASATAASTPGMMMGSGNGGEMGVYFPKQQQQHHHQRAQSYNFGSGMGAHMSQSNPSLMMNGMGTPMSMSGMPPGNYAYGGQMAYQQPTMNGMNMGMPQMQMYDPIAMNAMQMQMQMNGMGMGMQNGMHSSGIGGAGMGMQNGVSMNGMSMPMQMQATPGFMEEQPMEPKRRALIDRWRQSIQ